MSTAVDLEPGQVAVGLGGLLFPLEPVVDPVPVSERVVRPVALSAVALAVGFSLGAVVFYRRGRQPFALAHGVFGFVWTGLVLETLVGAGWLVVATVVLVVAGVGFLAEQARRR